MKTINSRQNEWFKRVKSAIRDHAGEIVIEGPKPVADAITAGWEPIAVIYRAEVPGGSQAADRGSQDLAFSDELFDALTETKTPQNVLGLFVRRESKLSELLLRTDSVIVALDAVQDPGNVGTIVRLAAAFDAAGVALLPGCADPLGPKAIRASVGAILSVPVVNAAAHDLIASGLPIFAADAASDVDEPPARAAILLFGNEGAGISPELRVAARPIAIAMSDRVESLNVASAAAILLSRSYALRSR